MAEDAINAVQQQLSLPVGGCITREHHLSGSEGYSEDYPSMLVAKYGVPAPTGQHLSEKFGTNAGAVLELARQQPELAQPIVDGFPAIQAEIAFSARREMAATLDDVLERRTGLQFYSWKTAMEAAPVVTAVMQREMGWDSAESQKAVDDYVGTISRWTQEIALAKSEAKA
jgi:glycerol-3-phosphate dehydrogenase